jgi:hypothetical protein
MRCHVYYGVVGRIVKTFINSLSMSVNTSRWFCDVGGSLHITSILMNFSFQRDQKLRTVSLEKWDGVV